jgi:hypothetical protein
VQPCQLVSKGIVAFIIPAQVFNNLSYKKLRDLMLSKRWLREVLYLGDKIFTAANNDVCVLFLNTAGVTSIRLVDALDFENPTVTDVSPTHFEQFGGVISVSSSAGADKIASKVFRPGAEQVCQHFEVFQGIVTGNNPGLSTGAGPNRLGEARKSYSAYHSSRTRCREMADPQHNSKDPLREWRNRFEEVPERREMVAPAPQRTENKKGV